MSKLEELVPPLELCKLIPEGEFEDSAFCWIDTVHSTFVELRRYTIKGDDYIPAPTLEEIMKELKRDYCKVGVSIRYDWCCYIVDEFGNDMTESDNSEAVVSALKLWLKLKGIR
jgi:hypothetical protein